MTFQDLLNEFFLQETRNKHVFSEIFDNVYANIAANLRKKFPGIDNENFHLDDLSEKSVASQFLKFFPAHYFKAYNSLLMFEEEATKISGTTTLIHWPGVTLVDIGCGAGAVSIALLTLLLRFQQFLTTKGKPLSPVKVLLIGIDINEHMLNAYNNLVKRYTKIFSAWLIDVQVETFAISFPSMDIDQVVHQVKPVQKYFVLIAMSNLIRVQDEMFERKETFFREVINQALNNELDCEPEFGMADARYINRIITGWKLDMIGVLSIATESKYHSWKNSLNKMAVNLKNYLSVHQIIAEYIKDGNTIEFINPSGSWWKVYKKSLGTKINYSWNYIIVGNTSYFANKKWQQLIKLQNLELGWARARRYAYSEALTDEVELLLFDHEIELKLDRLRKQMLACNWNSLNTEYLLHYLAPKSNNETRPKTISRVEEQVLAAAMIQLYGYAINRATASYSYRLKNEKGEYLYCYWLDLWKDYVKETHQNANGRTILSADIKEFYKNIDQFTLLRQALIKLDINDEKSTSLLETLLVRNCGNNHKLGKGLPQGHIGSGFWADIYLSSLDHSIIKYIQDVQFARYADDMFFALDSTVMDISKIEKNLWLFAEELGLELSDDKTRQRTGEQYIQDTALDSELDLIQGRVLTPLLEQLYRFDIKYWDAYQRDRIGFISSYNSILKSLSIYLSPSWLSRKLEQNKLRGGRLLYPPLDLFNSNQIMWVAKFLQINPEWFQELENLRNRLIQICIESIFIFSSPNIDKASIAQASRRFKFAAYRLCIFGINSVAELLTKEFLKNPWRLSPKLLCNGLASINQADLLLEIATQSELSYIRAVAIRYLADVDYTLSPIPIDKVINFIWQRVHDDKAELCEKLKATEALLLLDKWDVAEFSACQSLIKKTSDPYLQKNYALLIGQAFRERAHDYLQSYMLNNRHKLIVVDAIQYILKHQQMRFTFDNEPSLLAQYYSKDYPSIEADTMIDESPSGQFF